MTGELYHDILLGTITTTQYAGYGVNVWQVIDLRAVDEKNTEVTIHVALEPVERVGHRLKEWALTEYKDCLFRN